MINRVRLKPLKKLTKSTLRNYHNLINLIIETGGAIGYLKPLTLGKVKELLEPAIKNPSDAYILLAYDEDNIIGSGGLIRREEHVQKHVADIIKLMVHPKYRKLGLGKEIIKSCIKEGEKREIEIIFAEVRSNNLPAINLFKNIGFRDVAKVKNMVKIGSNYLDTIYFYLVLN